MQHLFTPKKIIITVLLLASAVILYFYLSVFMPIILAFFTAILLEPLVKSIQKLLRMKGRLPAVTIVFTLFVCFMATICYLLITKLVNEAIKFIDRIPYYIVEVTLFIDQKIFEFNEVVADFPPVLINELERHSNAIVEKGNEMAQQAIPVLASWAQAVPNLILVTIIYLITLFFISMDLPHLKENFYRHFKVENAKKVRYLLERLGYVFIGFFKAQFLVSIVIFIVSYIGLLLISPRNALMIAFIIWIIDFIPIIGSIIILSPWAIFNFITGEHTMGLQLLILAGVLLVLRRTLEPKIMGDHIGLSALSTLIAIYLGLYFFGILGLIIGPLFIIVLKTASEAGIIKTDFKI